MTKLNPYSSPDFRPGNSAATSRWDDPVRLQNLKEQALRSALRNVKVLSADSISYQPPRWLYSNWFEVGNVAVIVGDSGSGKTTLVAQLAAGITITSMVAPHPELRSTCSGHVIWITSEDSLGTVRARLEAAGADLSRVHFITITEAQNFQSNLNIFSPEGQQTIKALNHQLDQNVALIVLDPIYAYADFDPNNTHRARQAYESLLRLAEDLQCSIIGIAHAVKNQRGKAPLQRIGGPPALTQVPREIVLLAPIQNGPTESGATHVMLHVKNNNGNINGGFAYRIPPGDQVPIVEIVESIAGTPTEILAFAETIKVPGRRTKQEIAEEFIRETLCHGPRLRTEIDEMVKAQPFSKNTLELAKNKLKVVTKKRMGDGRSVWSLPSSTSP